MRTSRKMFSVAAVMAMTFVAAPASGQAWRGAPLDSLTMGANLLAGFPDGYDIFGAEVFKGFGAITAGLEYGLSSYEGDLPSAHTGTLNLALAVPIGTEAMGLFVSPVASPSYTSWEDLSIIQIPVGASLAYNVALGDGLSVFPYAIPQFVWSRLSYDDSVGDSESITESDFGWRAGGNLVVNNLVFGVGYGKVGDGDGTIGINVGMRFR